MKHLRRYNESLTEDEVDELRDFCETSFAYLMDEGFTIKIYGQRTLPYSSLPKGQFNVWLQKNNGFTLNEFFKWDDVKDYYIPFLQLLSNRYDIRNFEGERYQSDDNAPTIRFRYRQKKDYSFVNVNKDFSYNRVLNDNIFDSEGYWKDHIFYKWTPDPDLIGIGVAIKVKDNQIKLDI